ncbi:MAG: heme exporter protein CcmD [Alkalilacustris sp.]
MPELGAYWLEVTASYVVTLAILAGLVTLIWRRHDRVRRDLSDMEARARVGARTAERTDA